MKISAGEFLGMKSGTAMAVCLSKVWAVFENAEGGGGEVPDWLLSIPGSFVQALISDFIFSNPCV